MIVCLVFYYVCLVCICMLMYLFCFFISFVCLSSSIYTLSFSFSHTGQRLSVCILIKGKKEREKNTSLCSSIILHFIYMYLRSLISTSTPCMNRVMTFLFLIHQMTLNAPGLAKVDSCRRTVS